MPAEFLLEKGIGKVQPNRLTAIDRNSELRKPS